MKTLTLAATLAAASLSFAAAPAFAENALQESQKKIERALGHHDATPKAHTRASTYSQRDTKPLDRYQAAHKRLFKFRSPPSGK